MNAEEYRVGKLHSAQKLFFFFTTVLFQYNRLTPRCNFFKVMNMY